MHHASRHLLTLCGLLGLMAGCTSLPDQQVLQATLQERLPGAAAPTATSAAASAPHDILSTPLSQDAAQRLALSHSAALQSLVAGSQSRQAQALAQSRPGLLGLTLERSQQGDSRSLSRQLSLGLLDLLTWPVAAAQARREVALQQIDLARQVLSHLHDTRMQWVRAVAARQREDYLADVLSVSQTAAELARRMQDAGHFSPLQRTQYQVQEALDRTALTQARQQARMEREALIRLLGLDGADAQAMTLPDRLPELPATLPITAPPTEEALHARLDVRLALARWQAAQTERTHTGLGSVVDVDVGAQRRTSAGEPTEHSRELGLRLSAIDLGVSRRASASAADDAARLAWRATTLQAQSEWRHAMDAQRSAYEVAQSTRQTLLPLHQRLVDERLKQYNGMLVGPFELLAQARQYRDTVITALDAQRDYWLADAQLLAASEGSASTTWSPGATAPAAATATADGH